MEPTNTLTLDEVKELITARYRNVRPMLDELSRVAKTLLTAGPTELSRALRLTRTLYDEVRSEIVLEANVLLPALRNANASGKIHAEKLMAQLRKRRKELRILRRSTSKVDKATFGADLERFIDGRRVEMAAAERDTLEPGVRRDDVAPESGRDLLTIPGNSRSVT